MAYVENCCVNMPHNSASMFPGALERWSTGELQTKCWADETRTTTWLAAKYSSNCPGPTSPRWCEWDCSTIFSVWGRIHISHVTTQSAPTTNYPPALAPRTCKNPRAQEIDSRKSPSFGLENSGAGAIFLLVPRGQPASLVTTGKHSSRPHM